jgi:hypothetical protein
LAIIVSIQYLEHRDGRVFEVGKPWPGDDPVDENDAAAQAVERAVGPIFLLPETTETVEYEGDDGEDEEGEIITRPASYEIWCVQKAMYLAFFGSFKTLTGGVKVDREAVIQKMMTTTTMRYVVHVDQVVGYYEEWPTVLAYDAIVDRTDQMREPEQAPANGRPAEQQPRAQG